MRRFFCWFAFLLILGNAAIVLAGQDDSKTTLAKPWSIDLRVKHYFNSHTSYEFGNPFPPGQSPLSRLEFPMNSWWAGLEARRSISRFSVGVEAMRNITGEVEGIFMDSDWTNDDHPELKTIYSESNCRLEPSYSFRADIDMKVSDWLKLPAWFDLRPVVGYRWQRLAFITHDGTQYNTESGSMIVTELPGDGIRFDQTYWQYFVGFRGFHDLGRPLQRLPMTLHWQLDWAYVEGKNQDHHLLRAGNRFTYESTTGDAWHAALGLKMNLTKSFNAGVELDYLALRTKGSHRLVNDVPPIDFSFSHGVVVWSEQMNVMLNLAYVF